MDDMEMEMTPEEAFNGQESDGQFDEDGDFAGMEDEDTFVEPETPPEEWDSGEWNPREALIEVDGELIPLTGLTAKPDFPQEARREELSPYMELLQRYPELGDGGRLPSQVAASIRAGASPVVAYQDFLLARQQTAERVGQLREALRARCPGSAAGCGDGDIDGAFAAFDAALNGF